MNVKHPLLGNTILGAPPSRNLFHMAPQPVYRSLYIVDTQLKLLKALHLLAAICWVGGAFSLIILAGLRDAHVEEPALATLITTCIYYVDVSVVVPGILGCIVTGLVYSAYTNFGFFKYFWITYKWLISLSALFWGTLFIGPWADDVFRLAKEWGCYEVLAMIHNGVMPQTSWGGVAQFLLLLSVVAISVFRPTSMLNWYDDQHHQPAGVRHGG